MSLDLVVAHEDEPAMDALMRMQRFGIRRMPVVDEQGALVGLLALDDVTDFLSNEVKFLSALVAGRESNACGDTRRKASESSMVWARLWTDPD